MTRVVVVDDHRSYAEAICGLLLQTDGVEACWAVTSVDEALVAGGDVGIDVALVDVMLPGTSGIEGISHLRRRHPDVRIVVVTGVAGLDALAEAALAGADGFVTKAQSADEVVAAVLGDSSTIGEADLLARVVADMASREGQHGTPPVHLTPRERQILALLAEGTLLGDIARVLGIRVETCRGYVKSLLAKLGARSQLQAVVLATRMGLLPVDHPLTEEQPPG